MTSLKHGLAWPVLDDQVPLLMLLTKLARSLTHDQVAAIQEHLSVEQKKDLIELLRSMAQETPPGAAQDTEADKTPRGTSS